MSDFFKNEEEWEDYELLKKMAREESTLDEEEIESTEGHAETKILDHIYEIAYLHGNATFLHSMMDMADENENVESIASVMHDFYPELKSVSVVDTILVALKLYFRCEYDRYKQFKEKNQLNESNNTIEGKWDKFISMIIIWKFDYKYSIRAWILDVFEGYMAQLRDEYDTLYPNASEDARRLLEYSLDVYTYPRGWYYRLKYLRDGLHICKDTMPGTVGHLLWLILYVSEINEGLFETEDEFEGIGLSGLESLLSTQVEHFVTHTYEFTSNTPISMMTIRVAERLLPKKWEGRSYEEYIYHGIKRIIYNDPDLRKNFIWKKGEDVKHRCFAILTDFHRNNYVTISGYDFKLYADLIKLFKSCRNYYKYKDIPTSDFKKTFYGWGVQNVTYKELSQENTEKKRINKNIPKPQNYYRMFSCAERRLIDKYDSLQSKDKYVIIAQKKPCYMCERVLNNHKAKRIYFENYIMTDEDAIKKDLDSFADSL